MIKTENMSEKKMYDFVLNKSKTYTKELYKKKIYQMIFIRII